MEKQNIKIKYLDHSGFFVETAKNLLLFDYYQGQAERLVKESPKNVFIFSSHSHPDHFNPVILEWQKERPDIRYIFSHEISVSTRFKNINYLAPYESLAIADLKIKAYNSTDLGVAFLVRVEGTVVFHAGDLNRWYWYDDTPEGRRTAERDFINEIEKIKGQKIDLAFFPVDPRLREHYSGGAEYFIRELVPRFFVPMHFAEPESTGRFIEKMKGSSTRILAFSEEGQEIII
ncbi:MAG: MBL fold metallo-hydrolase [Desulfitobacteriaceae bacterium]|nr:MBL fold metallo-hydrolase [Desulfitobacteriaceae bacterium]MDD4345676.1 MBL fold metallo-hydrolase [Desulfitobacteriaceae bacterium]MDD4400512.1 MBL fold metallo-hydrolase [Desulfitobacteriaceae bacterium]